MTSVTAHLGKPTLIIHDVQIQTSCFWKSPDSIVTRKSKRSNKNCESVIHEVECLGSYGQTGL